MSSLSDPTLERIGSAALTLFAQHGYQRTSMADVARAAKVARATLYVRFADKTALFEHLARRVADDALAAAQAAWQDGAPLAENLAATLLAKDLPLYRLLHASPHGAELMAVDTELTRAHAERLDTGFAALLAERIATVPNADLTAFGGAEGFGRFVGLAGAGLKHEARHEADYRAAVERLAAVVARAATR